LRRHANNEHLPIEDRRTLSRNPSPVSTRCVPPAARPAPPTPGPSTASRPTGRERTTSRTQRTAAARASPGERGGRTRPCLCSRPATLHSVGVTPGERTPSNPNPFSCTEICRGAGFQRYPRLCARLAFEGHFRRRVLGGAISHERTTGSPSTTDGARLGAVMPISSAARAPAPTCAHVPPGAARGTSDRAPQTPAGRDASHGARRHLARSPV
jgi:hypothetical protein